MKVRGYSRYPADKAARIRVDLFPSDANGRVEGKIIVEAKS
jgi:hypothetical protein